MHHMDDLSGHGIALHHLLAKRIVFVFGLKRAIQGKPRHPASGVIVIAIDRAKAVVLNDISCQVMGQAAACPRACNDRLKAI